MGRAGAPTSPAVQDLAGVHALLVGVESYGLGNDAALDGPAHAVCEIAAWLRAGGAAPRDVLVHVSPKEENRNAVRSRLEALGLTHLEATEDLIRDTVIQKLRKRQGDMLLLYWCGHGFVESEFDRRLFYSDATQEDWRHIKFFDMLRYLQASQNPGFRRYVGFVDACAQFTAGAHPESALPNHFFPSAAEQAYRDWAVSQYVLLSTGRGEFAKGAQGGKGLPLFTRHLLDELKKLPVGQAPNPKCIESINRALQERFKALNEEGLADQIPSRYWVRDWRDNIDSLGPMGPRLEGLWARGWLPQEELDALAKALPNDFLPASLLKRLYRDCVPGNAKTPDDLSLQGILGHLINLPRPRQDTVAPLFRFVHQFAHRFPKARSGLKVWLDRVAQAHPDLCVRDDEAQETGECYYVTVVLGAEAVPLEATADRPEQEGRLASIKVWKGDDPRPLNGGWDPDEPVSLGEVREGLVKELHAFEAELYSGVAGLANTEVIIEFCLPRSLLSEPVDQWNYPDQWEEPQPLGAAYPVVLRDTQRPRRREPRLGWEERWRRLSQAPPLSVEHLPWLRNRDELPLGADGVSVSRRFFDHLPRLEPEDDELRVCVGFCFDLADDCLADITSSLLYGAWQAGLPAALWFRQPRCLPAEVKASFDELFQGTLLHELPRRLWELRREALERRRGAADRLEPLLAEPELLISLVWDDPSRIPYHPSVAGAAR